MANPIRLELHQEGDRTEIEIRVLHPMDPGDVSAPKSGRPRPPVFLQSMVIQLNERALVEGQLSASLSTNPKFGFSFSGVKAGDKFTVSCTDNKGREFKSEIIARS